MLKQMFLCAALVLTASTAIAEGKLGSEADARAMLDRAVAAIKADKAGAINKFNHNDPKFRQSDLFVFCFNADDGKYTAHEAMVTHDVRTFRDLTGRPVGDEMYRNAVEGGVLEVTYISPIPGSTDRVAKRAFVTRVTDQICGVSIYLPHTQTRPAL
jgi:hypothetical protein